MNMLGQKIRGLRKDKKLPLRTVSDVLGMDTSILSKIERGERPISKENVIRIATYFEVDSKVLLAEFYSDTIAQLIYQESICDEILKVAEQKVAYLKNSEN